MRNTIRNFGNEVTGFYTIIPVSHTKFENAFKNTKGQFTSGRYRLKEEIPRLLAESSPLGGPLITNFTVSRFLHSRLGANIGYRRDYLRRGISI